MTALAKLALHRGVSHFSNFSSLLPDLAEELFTNEINKGEEFDHVNESVDTYGATGFAVKVFYDNCSQQMSLQTSKPGMKTTSIATPKKKIGCFNMSMLEAL